MSPISWNHAQALVIGVGAYVDSYYQPLPYTISDARRVAEMLIDPQRCGYPPDRVQVLTGNDAILSNIRAALEKLVSPTSYDATTLIYFSGHGERESPATYLCPREADSNHLAQTALSAAEFGQAIAAIQTKRVLVVLDACHANGAAGFKGGGVMFRRPGLSAEDYHRLAQQGEGRAIIASSRDDQISLPYAGEDISWFTHHFLRGLKGGAAVRGDGLIRVLDLYHYISEAMRHENAPQDPMFSAKDMDMNFPIALDRGGKGGGGAGMPGAPRHHSIVTLREEIMKNPLEGARKLSDYLDSMAAADLQRTEIDRHEVQLKITTLQEVQRRLRLFGGDNPGPKAERNELIYFFLWVCTRLERGDEV